MTNKIQNSILRLLFLLLTLIVATGNITTSAYNNNTNTDYFQNCPTDFPYCYEQPNLNTNDQCTMATTYNHGNCVINEGGYSYSDSKIDVNKPNCSNYYTSNYYSCNSQYTIAPLPDFSTYNTESQYNTDYCGYLGANNCTNIAVNPPKTTLDPVFGCKPNLSNSYCYSYDNQTYPGTSTYYNYEQSNNQVFLDNPNLYKSSTNPSLYNDITGFESDIYNSMPANDSLYRYDYTNYAYYQ